MPFKATAAMPKTAQNVASRVYILSPYTHIPTVGTIVSLVQDVLQLITDDGCYGSHDRLTAGPACLHL